MEHDEAEKSEAKLLWWENGWVRQAVHFFVYVINPDGVDSLDDRLGNFFWHLSINEFAMCRLPSSPNPHRYRLSRLRLSHLSTAINFSENVSVSMTSCVAQWRWQINFSSYTRSVCSPESSRRFEEKSEWKCLAFKCYSTSSDVIQTSD